MWERAVFYHVVKLVVLSHWNAKCVYSRTFHPHDHDEAHYTLNKFHTV